MVSNVYFSDIRTKVDESLLTKLNSLMLAAGIEKIAVSYTHLTLPTNYHV